MRLMSQKLLRRVVSRCHNLNISRTIVAIAKLPLEVWPPRKRLWWSILTILKVLLMWKIVLYLLYFEFFRTVLQSVLSEIAATVMTDWLQGSNHSSLSAWIGIIIKNWGSQYIAAIILRELFVPVWIWLLPWNLPLTLNSLALALSGSVWLFAKNLWWAVHWPRGDCHFVVELVDLQSLRRCLFSLN